MQRGHEAIGPSEAPRGPLTTQPQLPPVFPGSPRGWGLPVPLPVGCALPMTQPAPRAPSAGRTLGQQQGTWPAARSRLRPPGAPRRRRLRAGGGWSRRHRERAGPGRPSRSVPPPASPTRLLCCHRGSILRMAASVPPRVLARRPQFLPCGRGLLRAQGGVSALTQPPSDLWPHPRRPGRTQAAEGIKVTLSPCPCLQPSGLQRLPHPHPWVLRRTSPGAGAWSPPRLPPGSPGSVWHLFLWRSPPRCVGEPACLDPHGGPQRGARGLAGPACVSAAVSSS